MYHILQNSVKIREYWLKYGWITCHLFYYLNAPGLLGVVNHNSTLSHWGRVTHMCVGKLTTICSDNGLSPGRRQAIIWTNARILLIGPIGTHFSEIFTETQTFSLKKMRLEMSSAECCLFHLGLSVLEYTVFNCLASWFGSIIWFHAKAMCL